MPLSKPLHVSRPDLEKALAALTGDAHLNPGLITVRPSTEEGAGDVLYIELPTRASNIEFFYHLYRVLGEDLAMRLVGKRRYLGDTTVYFKGVILDSPITQEV